MRSAYYPNRPRVPSGICRIPGLTDPRRARSDRFGLRGSDREHAQRFGAAWGRARAPTGAQASPGRTSLFPVPRVRTLYRPNSPPPILRGHGHQGQRQRRRGGFTARSIRARPRRFAATCATCTRPSAPPCRLLPLAPLRTGFCAGNGLLHNARLCLLEALARQPDEPALHFLLGDLYSRQGLAEATSDAFAEVRFLMGGAAAAQSGQRPTASRPSGARVQVASTSRRPDDIPGACNTRREAGAPTGAAPRTGRGRSTARGQATPR